MIIDPDKIFNVTGMVLLIDGKLKSRLSPDMFISGAELVSIRAELLDRIDKASEAIKAIEQLAAGINE